ncbi:urease subunit beta [Candidatus Haliotispira prima]|uniref:Urease subunit beta n=1 Tax=Candidatus Haliotispira prima TaxID=3034016 RepID=A0ABY8MLQ0_9SPIO|nr:urease subunit beta [Candidatus Haliotispira prima]
MMHNNEADWYPGQILSDHEELRALDERETVTLTVKNRGDRPVQVGSHFHFFEVNKALDFDRNKAWGMRPGIAPGTAVRFEPGQSQEISLIAMGGQRICIGLNGLAGGSLDDENLKTKALALAKEKGFKGVR